jgi:hypothetical protein
MARVDVCTGSGIPSVKETVDGNRMALMTGGIHSHSPVRMPRDVSKGRLGMNAITAADGVEIFYKDRAARLPTTVAARLSDAAT